MTACQQVCNNFFNSGFNERCALKILGFVLVLLFLGWGANFYGDFFGISEHQASQEMTVLAKAGGECAAISEQATAHLTPKLEFQRLELAGRKANVVVRCMADRGFSQNPAWLKYAQPIAASDALAQHISIDEALENLKRKDMLDFTRHDNNPAYWQQVKNQSTNNK